MYNRDHVLHTLLKGSPTFPHRTNVFNQVIYTPNVSSLLDITVTDNVLCKGKPFNLQIIETSIMTDPTVQSPTSQGPRLEVLDRVKNFPAVHSAIEKTGSTYSYLKDSHHLVNWALSFAEAGLHYATATAAPIANPLVKKFEDQINTVDQKLCQGLDIVEQKVPIVKQPPEEIYVAARNVMSSSLQPTVEKLVSIKESAANQATALKEISVNKANDLLSTHYGSLAVRGVDNTSVLVNRLLDHYFPPVPGEENQPAPVSTEENKVLHAVQTIGQLSTKTANRVYHSVSAQLKTVKKEDVGDYISSVISILHLTHFLNFDKEITNPPEIEEKKGHSNEFIQHTIKN